MMAELDGALEVILQTILSAGAKQVYSASGGGGWEAEGSRKVWGA